MLVVIKEVKRKIKKERKRNTLIKKVENIGEARSKLENV